MKNIRIEPSSTSLCPGPATGLDTAVQDRFSLIRRLKAPVWVFDIDNSRIVFANAPAFTLWQANDEQELCARDLSQNMSPAVKRRLQQYQVDFIEYDSVFTERWTLYPNGQPTSVMVAYSGIRLDGGRMAMFCEVLDGSEAEPENIRSAEALLHTDVMITQYAMDGDLLYMNPAARNAAVGSQHVFSDIFMDRTDYDNVMLAIRNTGEHRLVTQAHTGIGARWYDISAKRCLDAVTGKPAILVTATDVSELKVAKDKARYLADRDQLTGCYNRNYVQQHFETLMTTNTGKCALLYFDIDKFKTINDEIGHEMGDIVLKKLAHRARKLLRNKDLLGRLGGDEFVILLNDAASPDDISNLIDELQRAFGEPIRNADIALYVSKQSGRDQATYFNEEIGAIDKERRLIEADIRRGIAHNEFILHYQPRVHLQNGQTVSVEALVRWEHPDRGLIMPDNFIPICEETGMIEDLGKIVLDIGCKQALAWANAGIDMGVSINISPRQFQGTQLMDALKAFTKTPGFPRHKIELEITENVLFGDHNKIAEKLQEIVEMGYRIAIDDFGTGYSNLSYISRFPLDCIKIDKSFVSQLPVSGPIIQLILTLAKQVGATAVAEGVETRAEYDWLLAEGCTQVQGYYFSKPVPLLQLQTSFDANAIKTAAPSAKTSNASNA